MKKPTLIRLQLLQMHKREIDKEIDYLLELWDELYLPYRMDTTKFSEVYMGRNI